MSELHSPRLLEAITLASNALRVEVHDLPVETGEGVQPCWAMATRGLSAHGQQEILFILKRRAAEKPGDYPRMVVKLFEMILAMAARGQLVFAGGFTGFGEGGFLGSPAVAALGYVHAADIQGVTPEGALGAIVLIGDEHVVAETHGLTRVAARLGLEASHFPVPYWSDRDRAPVMAASEMSQSLLQQVGRLHVPGGSVLREGDRFILSLQPPAQAALGQLGGLPPELTVALLTVPHRDADALLVWRAGQRGPMAISQPGATGKRLSGAHCTFVPQQANDTMQVFEDGFALMLTDGTWERVRLGLASEKAIAFDLDDGSRFEVVWG